MGHGRKGHAWTIARTSDPFCEAVSNAGGEAWPEAALPADGPSEPRPELEPLERTSNRLMPGLMPGLMLPTLLRGASLRPEEPELTAGESSITWRWSTPRSFHDSSPPTLLSDESPPRFLESPLLIPLPPGRDATDAPEESPGLLELEIMRSARRRGSAACIRGACGRKRPSQKCGPDASPVHALARD